MNLLDASLAALMALLVAGYVAINFVAELPKFLVGENIALAVFYLAALILHLKGYRPVYPLIVLIAGFNAGRVSRSVVTPEGEPGRLALQHTPLLALVLIVALLALVETLKQS